MLHPGQVPRGSLPLLSPDFSNIHDKQLYKLINLNLGYSENLKERDHLKKLVMDSRQCTLQRWDANVSIGLIWVTI